MLSGSVCLNIYNTTQTDTGLMIISLYMLCLFIYEANENKAWNEPFRWLFKSGITLGCSVGNVTDMISTGGFSAFFKLSFFFFICILLHTVRKVKKDNATINAGKIFILHYMYQKSSKNFKHCNCFQDIRMISDNRWKIRSWNWKTSVLDNLSVQVNDKWLYDLHA